MKSATKPFKREGNIFLTLSKFEKIQKRVAISMIFLKSFMMLF